MRLWRFIFSALLLLGAEACFAAAGDNAIVDREVTPHVSARLVASVDAVTPGSDIYIGLNQIIIPHWHTYWSNAGDSGLPTTIEWTLPAGASASDILWPIPSRLTVGTITNFGYSDQVTLLNKIHVPADAAPGSNFIAQAVVDWLVCNEECIPEQVKLGLSLPVVAPGSATGSGSQLIQDSLAKLPVTSPWPISIETVQASAESAQDGFKLKLAIAEEHAKQIKELWFFPADWGVLVHNASQPFQITANEISLSLKAGEAPLQPNKALKGVLVVTEQTAEGIVSTGFTVDEIPAAAVANANADIGFVTALLLALVGGLILNLMPCVFPILSLKALSLVSHAQQSRLHIRLQGWAYTAGVLASFILLAAVLVILKAGGAQIGWGFQFQSPLFVLAMAYLLFLVGLNLSGVFVIGGGIAGVGSSLANRGGYSGSFFTGVLATIVATPCTAPFMAAALGYALSQPALKLFAIFFSLGFGLALPYLLLANWPGLQRLLPRPGAWMERTKQVLAFPMYAAAVWLVWVLAQQAGASAVLIALGGMVALAFAVWLYDSTRNTRPRTEFLGTGAAIITLLLTLFIGYTGVNLGADETDNHIAANSSSNSTDQKSERNWEPYSAERLQSLLAEGKPVFLNFTASWCISCLVNERVALSSDIVKDKFKTSGITYLKGDWTKRDAEITKILTQFGRSGVPLYVFYPAGKNAAPIELPQVLTPDIVLNKISTTTSKDAVVQASNN